MLQYDFIEQVSLDELLARSDFISLHTPHTPATEHIIDQDTIARMKDGVILINTARGALIDEQALADALATGKVLAAGLDVLTDEPPVCGSPLLTAPNTVITGHIAWLTRESRIRAIDMAIDNFRCSWKGIGFHYQLNLYRYCETPYIFLKLFKINKIFETRSRYVSLVTV